MKYRVLSFFIAFLFVILLTDSRMYTEAASGAFVLIDSDDYFTLDATQVNGLNSMVSEATMNFLKELDATATDIKTDTDENSPYYGDILATGEKYRIYVDAQTEHIRGIYLNAEKEDAISWDEETAKKEAEKLVEKLLGDAVKYDFDEKIKNEFGMWSYHAEEKKNGLLTGTSIDLTFSYCGNICALHINLAKDADSVKIDGNAAKKIADENLKAHAGYEAADFTMVQAIIAGEVVWKVYTDKYLVTIDATTAKCLCITEMK